MYVTICGGFCPDENTIASCGNRIRVKYTQSGACRLRECFFKQVLGNIGFF
ncbi:MAG: DUF6783 domain-containing protein [Blautia faecis]